MFRTSAGSNGGTVRIVFDGEQLLVPKDLNLAAALLTHTDYLRLTHTRKDRRGPYCMMGVCFDCLVTVDGRQNRRACMTAVRDGMIVSRQLQAPLPEMES